MKWIGCERNRAVMNNVFNRHEEDRPEEERRCSSPGCSTVLSMYNKRDRCFACIRADATRSINRSLKDDIYDKKLRSKKVNLRRIRREKS